MKQASELIVQFVRQGEQVFVHDPDSGEWKELIFARPIMVRDFFVCWTIWVTGRCLEITRPDKCFYYADLDCDGLFQIRLRDGKFISGP